MKESILFINPNYGSKSVSYFPLGIGYAAGACRKEGIDADFIDFNLPGTKIGQMYNKIREGQIRVVGIGGFITQLKSTLALAKIIKEISLDVTVIVGGVQVNGCEQLIMKNRNVDIACAGEAEIALPQLVHALYQNGDISKIDSIIYKKDDVAIRNSTISLRQNIDEISIPAYDIFPMEYYIKNNYHSVWGRRTLDFICSRGCPYTCNYCINSKKRTLLRYRSPQNILSEIRFLKYTYRINDFFFGDEIFTINKKIALDVCNVLKDENITWVTSVRADGIDDDLIIAMKSSGCRMLLIGFESGSNIILKSMNKRASVDLYASSIELLRRHSMPFYANFMAGMPEENENTFAQTEDFCKKNSLIFGASYVTPFPGTVLYDQVRDRIPDEDDYIFSLANMSFTKHPVINLTSLSMNKLIALREKVVINTVVYLVQKKVPWMPVFLIVGVSRVYLWLFNIRNPVIAQAFSILTKIVYKIFQK